MEKAVVCHAAPPIRFACHGVWILDQVRSFPALGCFGIVSHLDIVFQTLSTAQKT